MVIGIHDGGIEKALAATACPKIVRAAAGTIKQFLNLDRA